MGPLPPGPITGTGGAAGTGTGMGLGGVTGTGRVGCAGAIVVTVETDVLWVV